MEQTQTQVGSYSIDQFVALIQDAGRAELWDFLSMSDADLMDGFRMTAAAYGQTPQSVEVNDVRDALQDYSETWA